MPAFRQYVKLAKVMCGVSVTAGAITAAVVVKQSGSGSNNITDQNNNLVPTVLASWTTHFTPSVKWDSNWDRRDPESLLKPQNSRSDTTDNGADLQAKLQKLKPVANRHILMIRHGNYNLEGETDEMRTLTALGKEQAELTGLRLKELSFPYTLMIHSSMTRAKETADIIAKCLPDVPREECDMLREGAPIPPEPPVGHWKPELKQFFEDGARIEAAFRKYFHRADPELAKDSYELLVCHANVIRYFVCRVMQFPPEAWLRISLHHGSITWVTIRPSGRVTLRTLGDTGHMSPAKITSA